MTRGQKGCYIYCVDKNLTEYLKRRLNQINEIVYPVDGESTYDLMVAEDKEEV